MKKIFLAGEWKITFRKVVNDPQTNLNDRFRTRSQHSNQDTILMTDLGSNPALDQGRDLDSQHGTRYTNKDFTLTPTRARP